MTFAAISESAVSDQEADGVSEDATFVEKFKGMGQFHLTVMRPEVLRDQALC